MYNKGDDEHPFPLFIDWLVINHHFFGGRIIPLRDHSNLRIGVLRSPGLLTTFQFGSSKEDMHIGWYSYICIYIWYIIYIYTYIYIHIYIYIICIYADTLMIQDSQHFLAKKPLDSRRTGHIGHPTTCHQGVGVFTKKTWTLKPRKGIQPTNSHWITRIGELNT